MEVYQQFATSISGVPPGICRPSLLVLLLHRGFQLIFPRLVLCRVQHVFAKFPEPDLQENC